MRNQVYLDASNEYHYTLARDRYTCNGVSAAMPVLIVLCAGPEQRRPFKDAKSLLDFRILPYYDIPHV